MIAERYRIGDLLGRGSMGVVYAADDLHTNTQVAVKFLVMRDRLPKTVNRFFRGARLAQKINHRHVARTLDFGYHANRSKTAYLVMERIYGVPMTQFIESDLSAAARVGLIVQSLSALAHMHARRILHRDLKPDNILVEHHDDHTLSVRVTDFGLAAAMESEEEISVISAENMVVGTAAYMAPEQAVASTLAGPGSDVYAMGVILYELLKGERPFSGTPLSVLIDKTRYEAPRLEVDLETPMGLVDAIATMLSRDPGDRFLNAADAFDALDKFAETPHLSKLPTLAQSVALAPTVDGNDSEYFSRNNNSSHSEDSIKFDNPIWGRDDEVHQLMVVADQGEAGAGAIATVESSVGVEASAIVDHVAVELAENGRFIVLRGAFQEIAGAEGGLRQALEGYWRTHGLPLEILETTISAHLARHGVDSSTELDALLQFLRPAQSHDAAAMRNQNELFALFFRTLRRLAEEKPVCLVLDELHRGGPLAAAFFEYALSELSFSTFPLLVLTTSAANRGKDPLASAMGRNQQHRGRYLFEISVPRIETEEIAAALGAEAGLSAELAQRAARLSGGSPIAARQLAEIYLIEGLSDRLTDSIPGSEFSSAITNVLMRCIDGRLSGHADSAALRRVLDAFAVLGAAVEYGLLRSVASAQLADERFDDHLESLLDLEIIKSNAYDNEEVLFLSPSALRDRLLERQSSSMREALHSQAIISRYELAGDARERVAGFVGDHWAAMNQYERAVDHWFQAASFETRVGDPLLGAKWGAQVLDRIDVDDPRGIECALFVGRSLLDAGHLDQAVDILAPFVERSPADAAMIVGEVLADVYENQGSSTSWRRLVDLLTRRLGDADEVGQRAFLRTRSMWHNSYGQSRPGLADAIQALKMAPPGAERQRAAQRAVYCCLALNSPADGEPYALIALEESGRDIALRTRSLRALGTVLTWLDRAEEAITLHTEALHLCRTAGLFARIAIGYHDLGDAHRMAGQGALAEEAYAMALHCADELAMGHTMALVQVKQVMSALTDGRTEGVVERLNVLAPEALASGLGLAVPFCALLEAWAYSLDGKHSQAQRALERAGEIAQISVDPQVASIVATIAARSTSSSDHTVT